MWRLRRIHSSFHFSPSFLWKEVPRRGRRLALKAVFSLAGMLTPPRFARLPLPEEGARMILNRASPFIKIDAERRSGTLINDVLETHSPALFHTACALSAPSGHLPLEGKADDTRITSSNMRRSRHESPEP